MRRFTIRALMSLVAFFAIGLVGLSASTDIWANGIFTATLLILTASIILAVYRKNDERAFWLGFAVFGGVYLAASRTSIAPSLVTTLGLAWLQDHWPKSGNMVAAITDGASVTIIWIGTPANFHRIGHSLLTLVIGYLGGLFARYARRSRP